MTDNTAIEVNLKGLRSISRSEGLVVYRTDALILCYDVSDRESLEVIKTEWVAHLNFREIKKPIILLGLRCQEKPIVITEPEGRQFALDIKADAHFIIDMDNCSPEDCEEVLRQTAFAVKWDEKKAKREKTWFSWIW